MDDYLFDSGAERLVVLAPLDNPHLLPAVVALPPAVFVQGLHQELHAIYRALVADGEPVDHLSVSRRAIARLGIGKGKAVESFVISSLGKTTGTAIGFHVERLHTLAKARAVDTSAIRLRQFAEESVTGGDAETLRVGVDRAIEELNAIRADTSSVITDDDLPPSLADVLGYSEEYDWLVPGVLERTDRLILTGFEGTGKSYLLAQVALCIASGLNPFGGFPGGEPGRVLVVDCENSERQTARRYRRMRGMVEKCCSRAGVQVPDWSKQLRFVLRPEGVALNDPREFAKVERAVRATDPDMVIVGPLYRMHTLDTRDEQAAKELTDRLDELRVRYRLALVAEAHVAHGSGREARALKPIGSSLFLRWPEFGLGLRPAQGTEEEEHPSKVDIVAWRGGREDRVWPSYLRHDFQRLPWLADERYWMRLEQAGVKAGAA
ncbi:AAA family ATPase [Nocardia sp. BMG51109]|uniref:AAA family ATPase n=1 Tax=Nocardia sp. BMG51109 TaxID=1056816 RepID=UPI0004654E33|nr:AAA family ATPase [Nocardia sp. BMG51109]